MSQPDHLSVSEHRIRREIAYLRREIGWGVSWDIRYSLSQIERELNELVEAARSGELTSKERAA